MIIQGDVSIKSGRHTTRQFQEGGTIKEGEAFSIIIRIKIWNLFFTKTISDLTIHVQVDNNVALVYVLMMDDTRNPELLKTSKSTWSYLQSHHFLSN